MSVNCPSEPEKIHCLDITQINEAIEATKLQPGTLPRQHGAADGEQGGLKIILEGSSIPRISFLHYIKNANHSIENMTTNDELETCDEQLLFTTSTSLENLVNSNLSNLQHCAGDCDCEKKN